MISKAEVGIDVVAISRINNLLADYPEQFRDFVFTPAEREYCDQRAHPEQHYAVRWAAKEAFIKTLDETGSLPDLTDIEIRCDPAPRLSLTGSAEGYLMDAVETRNKSVDNVTITVSMTHERALDTGLAIVFVLF
jgi:holo-[acyl-carrier protein] synthase